MRDKINPQKLIDLLAKQGISARRGRPATRTRSFSKYSECPIIIQCESAQDIENARKVLFGHNPMLNIRDIGGGRNNGNASYSISKLWHGVDVLLQLIETPTVELKSSGDSLVTISPNIMLKELNQQLKAMGLHTPTLSGCLPVMSFAGGLSTGSHSSQQYLADLVQSITVVLPNGTSKTFNRGDEDFELICYGPSFGLLGTITSIDISVEPEAKKLQREVALSPFKQFIQDDLRQWETQGSLSSRIAILSAPNLSGDSMVKHTHLSYVPDTTLSTAACQQDSIGSELTEELAAQLTQQYPQQVAKLFHNRVLHPDLARTEVGEVHDAMGPEALVYAKITEVGLMFQYTNTETVQAFFHFMQEKMREHHAAVNTAVFIRFPHSMGQATTPQHDVCVDFASMGLDSELMHALINVLIDYLQEKQLQPRAHWGKTGGLYFNRRCNQQAWEDKKTAYREFYANHCLNQDALKAALAGIERPAEIDAHRELFKQLQGRPMLFVEYQNKNGSSRKDNLFNRLLRLHARIETEYKRHPDNPKVDVWIKSYAAIDKDYQTLLTTPKENLRPENIPAICTQEAARVFIYKQINNPDEKQAKFDKHFRAVTKQIERLKRQCPDSYKLEYLLRLRGAIAQCSIHNHSTESQQQLQILLTVNQQPSKERGDIDYFRGFNPLGLFRGPVTTTREISNNIESDFLRTGPEHIHRG